MSQLCLNEQLSLIDAMYLWTKLMNYQLLDEEDFLALRRMHAFCIIANGSFKFEYFEITDNWEGEISTFAPDVNFYYKKISKLSTLIDYLFDRLKESAFFDKELTRLTLFGSVII